jgi:hypothetical protein
MVSIFANHFPPFAQALTVASRFSIQIGKYRPSTDTSLSARINSVVIMPKSWTPINYHIVFILKDRVSIFNPLTSPDT